MKILLDTQIFLWAISGDARLSGAKLAAFESEQNELFLSMASLWEILVKHRLGKLDLPTPATPYLNKHLERNRVAPLPIRVAHFAQLEELPLLHRDPFDRMIVAQAQAEGLAILTADEVLRGYQVQFI